MGDLLKIIILLTLAAATLSGEQSIVLAGANQVTGTFPSGSPFNSVGQYRIEFRYDGLTLPVSSEQYLFTIGNSNTTGLVMSLQPDASNFVWNPTNVSPGDVLHFNTGAQSSGVCRYQKTSAGALSMECWALSGANYQVVTGTSGSSSALNLGSQPITVGYPASNTNLGWLRLYNTTVALNSPPPSLTNGSLGDWEFEGNLTDTAGFTALSGTASYTTTPVVPINVIFGAYGQQRVWSANHGSLSLDGESSYSPIMNFYNLANYAWSEVTVPVGGTFTGSGPRVSYAANQRGNYSLRLTVTDGVDAPANTTQDFGAVITDTNRIVQTGNASLDTSLGPLTMWGAATTPWPWYDFTEMADADSLSNGRHVYKQS